MLRTLVHDYGWIHLTIGILGHLQFFAGSILFLERFSEYKSIGVWLFIVGSGMMLLGKLGSVAADLLERDVLDDDPTQNS